MRFDLSDEEWTIIEPLLPPRIRGPKRVDDRKILNGIFYILRTGTPWRDLPERYGPCTTVYNRYAMRNVAERFFCTLSMIEGNHLRAMNKGHAQTGNSIRKTQSEFPRNAAFICH